MSRHQEITFTLDVCAGGRGIEKSRQPPPDSEAAGSSIPRVARLMALAIRLESLGTAH
jgi:hypothetical protein